MLRGQVQQGGRDGREEEMTCDAAAGNTRDAQQIVRGEKRPCGPSFLIWQVKNSKLLEKSTFFSLVNFLRVVKSQYLPS